MMHQTFAEVIDKEILTDQIILLTFKSDLLTLDAKPGQFVNIRITDACFPYLRRPFSYCDVENDVFKILFTIYGQGTKVLANSQIGSSFDIIGPLGNGFSFDENFDTAVFIGGGLGIAPFPFLNRVLSKSKKVFTYIGARSKDFVVTYGLDNIRIATDDGSLGFEGSVVDLLKHDIQNNELAGSVKVFGCGPTPMLRALKLLCEEFNLNCEVSTEAAMACGFGICQGCPIETFDSSGYKLVCKDGPVFNIRDIRL